MSDLLAGLDELRERLKEIPQADERRLQELKTELLGRRAGALTEILKALPGLDAETRKTVGGAANALKRELEHAVAAREAGLKRGAADLAEWHRWSGNRRHATGLAGRAQPQTVRAQSPSPSHQITPRSSSR